MFPASVPWSWRVSDSFTLAARSWDLRNSASLRLTHLTPTHSHFLGKVRWDDSYTQSNGWAFCVVHLFRQGPAGSDAALFLRSVLMNVGDLRKQIWCLAQIAACIARPPTNILFGALRIWFLLCFYAFHLRKKPTVHLYKDACKAWHIPEDVKQFVERKSDAGSLSFKEPGQKFQ